MMPLVGAGSAHEAESMSEDPSTLSREKFLGAGGTTDTRTYDNAYRIILRVSKIGQNKYFTFLAATDLFSFL